MRGFRGIITRMTSVPAQNSLLALMAVLLSFMFMCALPQRISTLRQYLPCRISPKWFLSFCALDTMTNIDLAQIYFDRAGNDIKQEKFEEALAEYDKTIQLAGTLQLPYFERGCLYLKLGKPDRAIKDFIKAIALDPKFIDAYNDLGFTYANKGQYAKALATFTKLMQVAPNYPPAYYNREVLYVLMRRYDKAWGDVHRAESLGIRDNPAVLNMLKRTNY